jgi:hypothetical protein
MGQLRHPTQSRFAHHGTVEKGIMRFLRVALGTVLQPQHRLFISARYVGDAGGYGELAAVSRTAA